MADEYRRFWITSRAAEERERLLAEAFEAGAEGAEETEERAAEGELRYRACVYAPMHAIEAVRQQVVEEAGEGCRVDSVEALPEVDWSEAWKQGLDPIRVSERLVIRPPFAEYALEPDQREILIDPGQAFGIGGHASTRLCLEWIDALLAEPDGAERYGEVLDVGTGSGVLALAALALGARSALGFDLDPLAIEAAEAAARANALEARARFWLGPIEQLDDPVGRYPLVLANLLKQEMLPIAGQIAARLAPQGRLILAGLLEEDGPEVVECFVRSGLVEVGRRSREDGIGTWIGLCLAFA